MGARFPGKRHFRDGGARDQQFVQQSRVLRRVYPLVTAGKYGNCAALEAAAMGSGVNTARKPGHDGETCLAELPRNTFGKFYSRGGSIA